MIQDGRVYPDYLRSNFTLQGRSRRQLSTLIRWSQTQSGGPIDTRFRNKSVTIGPKITSKGSAFSSDYNFAKQTCLKVSEKQFKASEVVSITSNGLKNRTRKRRGLFKLSFKNTNDVKFPAQLNENFKNNSETIQKETKGPEVK